MQEEGIKGQIKLGCLECNVAVFEQEGVTIDAALRQVHI